MKRGNERPILWICPECGFHNNMIYNPDACKRCNNQKLSKANKVNGDPLEVLAESTAQLLNNAATNMKLFPGQADIARDIENFMKRVADG